MTSSHYAQIDWQDGQPISKTFGDVYFSRESGLNETEHVFLTHNRLQQRWKSVNKGCFVIAETGFGTGLNFLSAWRLWNQMAPPASRLHVFSMEKHPLSRHDLTKVLELWPELKIFSGQLLDQYRWLTHGWHTLIFENGRVTLTLAIGDACEALSQLVTPVDAWFLDGFAPARNPDMWQKELFGQMARLSHAGTTFATFTSAGIVRRSLETAGFQAEKVKGYGRKREMLCGRYTGLKPVTPEIRDKRAIVIGGGIAGSSSSHALARRGWQVTLIERHGSLAQEASGNPVGILYPRLSKKEDALDRLNLHGYLHTLRLLRRLPVDVESYHACGLLQLGFDARELNKCKAIAARGLPEDLLDYVSANEASKLSGITLLHDALHFPDAGWISPSALCVALTRNENITIKTSTEALRLERRCSLWQVTGAHGLIAEAPIVILANAADSLHFEQTNHLPLEPVRGQITLLQEAVPGLAPRKVICSDGYVSPSVRGTICTGATFSPDNDQLQVLESDHEANLSMLKRISSVFHQKVLQSRPVISGRAAFRCTTQDYLPLAGQLIDRELMEKTPPRYNASPATLPWMEGLYVSTGYGSKGLTTAPLCAEILASIICGEPAPVDAKLMAALSPNRFLLRKMGLKLLLGRLAYSRQP